MPDPHITNATKEAAITAALNQNWSEAIKINTILLKGNKDDLGILNRLGYAYLQDGQFTQAKKIFNRVLKLDPYNQIASRNLKKVGTLKRRDLPGFMSHLSPMMFLEDPGKTKIAACVNLAPGSTLSFLCAGQEVSLRAKKHAIEIRDAKNVYLGALPDDLSFKLIKFLGGGNHYHVAVKSVGKNSLSVFLREVSRGKKFRLQPSFITPAGYVLSPRVKTDAESEGDVPPEENSEEG